MAMVSALIQRTLVGVWYNRESVCEVCVCVEHLCGVEFR